LDITLEATYESGVLKPLEPLTMLKDHERVRITVHPPGIVAEQRKNRIKIDPAVSREIAESADCSLFGE
jgi:predicted DNA-binding antitoxin AbrB/MazE fold protein